MNIDLLLDGVYNNFQEKEKKKSCLENVLNDLHKALPDFLQRKGICDVEVIKDFFRVKNKVTGFEFNVRVCDFAGYTITYFVGSKKPTKNQVKISSDDDFTIAAELSVAVFEAIQKIS